MKNGATNKTYENKRNHKAGPSYYVSPILLFLFPGGVLSCVCIRAVVAFYGKIVSQTIVFFLCIATRHTPKLSSLGVFVQKLKLSERLFLQHVVGGRTRRRVRI